MASVNTIGRLDPFFTRLIDDLMAIDRQPRLRLEQQQSAYQTRLEAYEALRTLLEDLRSLAGSLTTGDPFTVLKEGRSVSVTPQTEGASVVTASASASAGIGTYDIQVTALAKPQRRASAVQASADQPLGLSGTLWLGGTGTASASVTANSTVTGVGTAAVAAGVAELGTGTYTVETRDNNGTLEFRLVDVDGRAVAIADVGAGDGSLTSDWQAVPANSTYDTLRGLTITFGSGSDPATQVQYTAAGVAVSVAAGDSLVDIAENVNTALQPEGREVSAAVVGTQLILTAVHTGTAHTMILDDQAGLGFTGSDLQAAQDASFSVNGIAFTRSSNTGLTDVIYGVTLNLAPDAEGERATLAVERDTSQVRQALEDFIAKFNEVQAFLEAKTSVTNVGTEDTAAFVRGALAEDPVFSELRGDLFGLLVSDVSNSGAFLNLRQIGVTLGDALQVEISDEAALEEALQSNFDDVVALLDAVMQQVQAKLDLFVDAEAGILSIGVGSFQEQLQAINSEMAALDQYLLEREQSLILQFGAMQAQLLEMTYLQQQWAGIYGGLNRLF